MKSCVFRITMTWKQNTMSQLFLSCLIASLLMTRVESRICEIKGCTVCSHKQAECITDNQDNPIPQELNHTTKWISITYYGTDITLEEAMFSNFKELTVLTLRGNFRAIQNNTFRELKYLTNLTLTNVSLTNIEDDAFGSNSSITSLNLTVTKLKFIPTQVFHSLNNLEVLDLSVNTAMTICSPEIPNVGMEFSYLTSLTTLKLNWLGQYDNCGKITDAYFKPIAQVKELHLSASSFLEGPQTVLKPLSNLTILNIDGVDCYKRCPSNARELFSNLPNSLEYLSASAWKTNLVMNESCTFNTSTLEGLKRLPNLTALNLRYSDKIFGNSIRKELFQGFPRLQYLDVGWCRFNDIETGAFSGLNLQTLVLDTNQLGNREFWPYGQNSTRLSPPLRRLSLYRCGIALDYYAYFIARTFPNLEVLNLDHNKLDHLPVLRKAGHITPVLKIKELTLSYNILYFLSGDPMTDICDLMPNLENFNVASNRISFISDLCLSLTTLDLANNYLSLYGNIHKNLAAISLLRNLRVINLSNNNISCIPEDLFEKMKDLELVNLADNALSHIDQHVFDNNQNLLELHLQYNQIATFNISLITPTSRLRLLDISDNHITVFNKSFTDFMNRKFSLHTVNLCRNPFDCTCGHSNFRDWLKNTSLVHSESGFDCAITTTGNSEKVYDYEDNFFICDVGKPLLISIGVIAAVLLAVFVAIPCYRYRWYIAHMRVVLKAVRDRAIDVKYAEECKYDAMICCNNDSRVDLEFAKILLQKLEEGDFPRLADGLEDERVSKTSKSH